MTGAEPAVANPTDGQRVRVVAWNCAGALQLKLDHVLEMAPDIAVIAEAARPERLALPEGTTSAWVGRVPYKGLLVLGFGGAMVEAIGEPTPLEWLMPVRVTGSLELDVLAVWSSNKRAKNWVRGSLVQPHAAVELFGFQQWRPHLVIGDFNNHPRWDQPGAPKFMAMVEAYRQHGLHSLYHHVHGEPHGDESQSTHWWRYSEQSTYHIDYAFVREDLLDGASIQLGSFAESVTKRTSDHARLTVDLQLSR